MSKRTADTALGEASVNTLDNFVVTAPATKKARVATDEHASKPAKKTKKTVEKVIMDWRDVTLDGEDEVRD